MESVVNSDQNFYSRPPNSPRSDGDREIHVYDIRSSLSGSSIPPERPPKVSLANSDEQATTANGYDISAASHESEDSPDDFYREYEELNSKDISRSRQIYTNSMANGTISSTGARVAPSSLRSNGNGTTPKYPSISGLKATERPSYRSASASIEENASSGKTKPTPALDGIRKASQPSVKDLLKHFDQGAGSENSTGPRPHPKYQDKSNIPAAYAANRFNPQIPSGSRQSNAAPTTKSPNASRVISPPTSRISQRSKFTAEDQHSNNTLSALTRPIQTRNKVSGSAGAPMSLASIVTSQPSNPQSSLPVRKPLFGEVISTDSSSSAAGYGINQPSSSSRRISDTSIRRPGWTHVKSDDDHDVSPSSPTAWYLGVASNLEDIDITSRSNRSQSHARSQSDSVDLKSRTEPESPPFTRDSFKAPDSPNFRSMSRSRLPVSSRRTSHPSDSASPPSTRAASPYFAKAGSPAGAKARTIEPRPWSPPANSNTISPPTSRRQGRSPGKIPTVNSSLKVYVSTPPPKLSPPLRSSRPRQPVSAATTASSRAKATESYNPIHGQIVPKSPRSIPREQNRNQANLAEKRAQLLKNIPKQIRESEQKEHDLRKMSSQENSIGNVVENEDPRISEPKLVLNTSFLAPTQHQLHPGLRKPSVDFNDDSPTLGMPGSFPTSNYDNDVPISAASNATGMTFFDNEPQTEAPKPSQSDTVEDVASNAVPVTLAEESQSILEASLNNNPENDSIQIILDTTSLKDLQDDHDTEHDGQNDASQGYQSDDGYTTYHIISEDVLADSQTSEPLSIANKTRQDHHDNVAPVGVDSHGDYVTADRPVGITHSAEDRLAMFEKDTDSSDSLAPSQTEDQISWPVELTFDPAPSLQLPRIDTSLDIPYTGGPIPKSEFLGTPVTEMDYENSDIGEAYGDSCEGASNNDPSTFQPKPERSSETSNLSDFTVEDNDRSSWVPRTKTPSREHAGSHPPIADDMTPANPNISAEPIVDDPDFSPEYSEDLTNFAGPEYLFRSNSSFQSAQEPITRISSWNGKVIPPIPQAPSQPPHELLQPLFDTTFDEFLENGHKLPPPFSMSSRYVTTNSQRQSYRDSDSMRASGDDYYAYRPSTSTRRSSAQISFEGEAIGTPVSFNEQTSLETGQTAEDSALSSETLASLRQRRMLIQELIDTEAVYLKDMNVVVEIYKGTAEACPKLDSNDIKCIFRNSEELIEFSTAFLGDIKAASASIYIPRSKLKKSTSANSSISPEDSLSIANEEGSRSKDRRTTIGANFARHIEEMERVYAIFLRSSEQATSRLQTLQADSTVKVWLEECNAVAKDLSGAWDLDALLVKPVQRITRYQLLLGSIVKHTDLEHPDYESLKQARDEIKNLLENIDNQKKRINMVTAAVNGRKRKDSNLRVGLKNPFKSEKATTDYNWTDSATEDKEYGRCYQNFTSQYMHLQVTMRDAIHYTEGLGEFIDHSYRTFLAFELFCKAPSSAGRNSVLESKWAHFSLVLKDLKDIALQGHRAVVQDNVIKPFEELIRMSVAPSQMMRRRQKKRIAFEKAQTLKGQNKKVDEKLAEQVEEYIALNDTLKIELPKLHNLTCKTVRLLEHKLMSLHMNFLLIWQDKLKTVLEVNDMPKDIEDIMDKFNRDYKPQHAIMRDFAILNGAGTNATPRVSQTTSREDDISTKPKSRASTLNDRTRGLSVNSDVSPGLSTPEFGQHGNGSHFVLSPTQGNPYSLPQLSFGNDSNHFTAGQSSTIPQDALRHHYGRPNTGFSHESGGLPRRSGESADTTGLSSADISHYNTDRWLRGSLPADNRFSDAFSSAVPWPNEVNDVNDSRVDGDSLSSFNVLYLAASLYEFRIDTTKSEGGYPYLTYASGEIFDVLGEKGELWLAKNQDDPTDKVGWIWCQHFAKVEY